MDGFNDFDDLHSSETEALDIFGNSTQDLERLEHNAHQVTSGWHGMAFLVEAIVLLAFLTGSIAVFMTLFARAENLGKDHSELSGAIVVATNVAETFANDPTTIESGEWEQAGYVVKCTVTPKSTEAGVLYCAEIDVADNEDGKPVYELSTERYVSNAATATTGTESEVAANE